MTLPPTPRRTSPALTPLAAAALSATLSSCATPPAHLDAPIPAALAVPADQVRTLETRAEGVQIYRCAASKNDPTRFEWRFEAPEATLYDAAGHVVAKHYAGPSWEAPDGSKVVGEVRARADSAEPGAIPQLLLHAKTTSGSGVFATVSSVQRLATTGGAAPAGDCAATQADQVVRVPYRALYFFYAPKA